MQIELKPYQYDFVYSKARHPAFVGGWSTGKTLCAISRALIYSKGIPDNLGIVFRKTARSLFDSTLKDFEKYTKLKVDSQRNYTFGNNSIIMFRHIDEIADINQQNINLGWFYIEQGDELDSDKEFFMLFGRLRRELEPTPEFVKLGIPLRSGWVIANAGDHWMKPLWKEGKLKEQAQKAISDYPDLFLNIQFTELIEADTWQNADVLPQDFLATLRVLEKTKPEMYKAFVLNDWNVSPDQFIVIPAALIETLQGASHFVPFTKRIISCDPATGGDECVIYVWENTKIIDEKILHLNDTMKITGELMILSSKHNTNDFAIDTIGVGKGIVDRLNELKKNVISINSAEEANDKERFYNRRAEMWWHCLEQIQQREIEYFTDDQIKKELSSVRYKVVNSNGKIQIEPKEETKKRLGKSPDRADAFIYGIWGLSQVQGVLEAATGGINKKRVYSGAGAW